MREMRFNRVSDLFKIIQLEREETAFSKDCLICSDRRKCAAAPKWFSEHLTTEHQVKCIGVSHPDPIPFQFK